MGLWLLLLLIPIGLVAGVIAIIAAIVSGVSTAIDEDDLPTEPGVEPGRGEVNVMSVEGFADLVAAIEEETGSSTVFEAVLYPGYAVVDVPVDATTNREHSYYWDGDLEETGSKSTTDYRRFDLADVDANVVVSIVDQARAKVEDPQSWYSIIRAPSDFDDGTWIWGYATNEYGESGYLGGDKAGTITWDPEQLLEVHPESGARAPDSGLPESAGVLLSDGDQSEPEASPGSGWMTNQEVGRWLERRPGRHAPATRHRWSISCWAPMTWRPSASLGSRVGDRRQPRGARPPAHPPPARRAGGSGP